MTDLKTVKRKLPARKIFAVIVAGAIVGGLQAGLRLLWPEHPFAPLFEDLDVWLQMGIMVIAGYTTKEKNV